MIGRFTAVAVLAVILAACVPSAHAQALGTAGSLNNFCRVYDKWSDSNVEPPARNDSVKAVACMEYIRGVSTTWDGKILNLPNAGFTMYVLSDTASVQKISKAFTTWMRLHPEDKDKAEEVVLFVVMLKSGNLIPQPVLQAVNN